MTTTSPPGTSPGPPEDAFRALFEASYRDLLRFVERRAHPSHAEDVVADVFLVAWRRWAEVPEGRGAARAWLYGVARNALLNSRRGADRQQALAVRIAEVRPVASTADDDLLARRLDVAAVWPRLSATDQEALALAAWEDLSAPEAAAVIGISPVAFRLRLSRARRSLRRLLDAPLLSTPTATAPEGHQS